MVYICSKAITIFIQIIRMSYTSVLAQLIILYVQSVIVLKCLKSIISKSLRNPYLSNAIDNLKCYEYLFYCSYTAKMHATIMILGR